MIEEERLKGFVSSIISNIRLCDLAYEKVTKILESTYGIIELPSTVRNIIMELDEGEDDA